MNRVSAYDLDGTLRHGNILGEAVLHLGEMDRLNLEDFVDPARPSMDEVTIFLDALKGLSHRHFDDLTDRIREEAPQQLMSWARDIFDSQPHDREHRLIISQNAHFLVEAFARGIQARGHRGSELHIKDGVFTGTDGGSLNKAHAADEFLRHYGVSQFDIAAGDSINDVPLLVRAKKAFVINPSPAFAEVAHAYQWEIVRCEPEQAATTSVTLDV